MVDNSRDKGRNLDRENRSVVGKKLPVIVKVRKQFHVIGVLMDLWRDDIYDEYQRFLTIRNGLKKIRKEVEDNEKMQKHRATS